ncbi:hypothetical protein J6590_032703, partial [Homalodisca vitripennis]
MPCVHEIVWRKEGELALKVKLTILAADARERWKVEEQGLCSIYVNIPKIITRILSEVTFSLPGSLYDLNLEIRFAGVANNCGLMPKIITRILSEVTFSLPGSLYDLNLEIRFAGVANNCGLMVRDWRGILILSEVTFPCPVPYTILTSKLDLLASKNLRDWRGILILSEVTFSLPGSLYDLNLEIRFAGVANNCGLMPKIITRILSEVTFSLPGSLYDLNLEIRFAGVANNCGLMPKIITRILSEVTFSLPGSLYDLNLEIRFAGVANNCGLMPKIITRILSEVTFSLPGSLYDLNLEIRFAGVANNCGLMVRDWSRRVHEIDIQTCAVSSDFDTAIYTFSTSSSGLPWILPDRGPSHISSYCRRLINIDNSQRRKCWVVCR